MIGDDEDHGSIRITYALKWTSPFSNDGEYLAPSGRFTTDRKEARRFKSAESARKDSGQFFCVFFGSGGPNDVTGWKVIRLIRRVPA